MAAQRLSQLSVEEIPYAERAAVQSAVNQGTGAMTQPNVGMKQAYLSSPGGMPDKNPQLERQMLLAMQNDQQNAISSVPQAMAGAKSQMTAESAARDTELSLAQQFAMDSVKDTMYGTPGKPGTGALRTMELGSMDKIALEKVYSDMAVTRAQNPQAPELSQMMVEANRYKS